MDPNLADKLNKLSLREREIAYMVQNVPCIKEQVFRGLGTDPHDEAARSVLGHLATARDLFHAHPSPKKVPFDTVGSEHKEMPYFLLGSHYVSHYHIAVLTTAEGWAMVYQTPLSAQIEHMRVDRSVIIVGKWVRTDLDWLATTETKQVDFRRVNAFPGSKGLKGDDLFVAWHTWATTQQAP